jgi:hypothetical protein
MHDAGRLGPAAPFVLAPFHYVVLSKAGMAHTVTQTSNTCAAVGGGVVRAHTCAGGRARAGKPRGGLYC